MPKTKPVKVVIVYASAGSGHRKAAEAIFSYLKAEAADTEVILVDILDYTRSIFSFSYRGGYAFLIRRTPFLWYIAFWITYSRFVRRLARLIAVFTNRLNARDFINFLKTENPDFVVSTHFLPSEITAGLKGSRKISSKLITVITDFVVHPYWISRSTDLYVVGCLRTKEELLNYGVEQRRIKVTGIPVASKFNKVYDKEELCRKFGLDRQSFKILIITGSFGIGPIERIVRALGSEAQLLVICANNKSLYARLSGLGYGEVRAFGFVDNMEEFMAVADVLITKPGGLTISEALARELPLVFISAIPGQEAGNARVLVDYDIGRSPRSIAEIKKIILQFKRNSAVLADIRKKIEAFRKTESLKQIYDVIREGSLRTGS